MTYVFVIGPPRSGTTLMLQAVGLHPRVAAFGEELHRFHHELKLFPHRHGEDEHFRLTARDASDGIRRDYEDALRAAVRHSGQDVSARGPGRTAASQPATVVVKISTLSLQIDYVKALFPEARFVQCVRDPRDTVCSMEDLRLALQREQIHPRILGPAPDPLALWAAEHFDHPHLRAGCSWFYHATRSYFDLQFAGADTFTRLRYEDFISAPRAGLKQVMDFIGVGFAPEQEAAVSATTDAPGDTKLGFSTSQASGPRKARFMRDMQPEVRTVLAPLFARAAPLFGYTPDPVPSDDELSRACAAIGADVDRWSERIAMENAWLTKHLRVFNPDKMLRENNHPLPSHKPLLVDGATFGTHADRRDDMTSVAHAWVQKQNRKYVFADEPMLWPALARRLDGSSTIEELVAPEHLKAAREICGHLHAAGLLGYA